MSDKKYNTSLGGGFSNDKFGEGSIKIDLTAENIKAFSEEAQVGGSILVRYNKVTTKGNKHYFVELLEPYKKPDGATVATAGKTKGAGKASQLG